MGVGGLSTSMLVVFGLIFVTLVLFVTEVISSDITAVGVLVALVVLEPFTGVAARDAIAAVLLLFYLLTGLLANIITPVASVVLLIPIAVDTASRIGADGFAFLLAVTFAGSAAFMTPIGYQTNLMVYGPGGYKFTDYVRVGAPLQLLLSVVTTVGIVVFFGV